MNIAIWIVQGLTAVGFIMAGGSKVITPIEELAAQMAWAGDVPPALVTFIGICEVLGALGILLPALTRILPWLTSVAAAGLALVMVLSIGFHLTRGEFMIIPNIVLLALALFIAYGRFKLVPIEAK